MLGNLMELFGGPKPQPVAVEPPKEPASVTANPAVPGDGTPKSNGSVAAIPPAAEGDASPLANFADLWQAPDPKTTAAKPSLRPNFTIDDKVIRENAAKIDFSKAIPADVLTKAAGGDGTALAQAITLAAQAGFAQSAKTTAQMVQAALDRQATTFETSYAPDMLRRHAISQEVRADNPLFENPAVAPILATIESQLATKNPTSSPEQISKMAKEFLGGFSEAYIQSTGRSVAEAPDTSKNKRGKKEPDWGNYFGVTPIT